MFQNELDRAAAGELRRLHPGRFLLGKGLAPGEPGIFGPGNRRQRDNGVLQSASQHTGYRQREHQSGEGKEQIGNPHEHRIQCFAVPAADHAHGGSQSGDDRNQQKGGKNTGSAAHNDPGQHIPSVAVRAQKMLRIWRLLGNAQILQIGVIGGQILREKGAYN